MGNRWNVPGWEGEVLGHSSLGQRSSFPTCDLSLVLILPFFFAQLLPEVPPRGVELGVGAQGRKHVNPGSQPLLPVAGLLASCGATK